MLNVQAWLLALLSLLFERFRLKDLLIWSQEPTLYVYILYGYLFLAGLLLAVWNYIIFCKASRSLDPLRSVLCRLRLRIREALNSNATRHCCQFKVWQHGRQICSGEFIDQYIPIYSDIFHIFGDKLVSFLLVGCLRSLSLKRFYYISFVAWFIFLWGLLTGCWCGVMW